MKTKTAYIQNFGHLLILDLSLGVVGISDYLLQQIQQPHKDVLEKSIYDILPHIFPKAHKKLLRIMESFVEENPPRVVINAKIQKKRIILR